MLESILTQKMLLLLPIQRKKKTKMLLPSLIPVLTFQNHPLSLTISALLRSCSSSISASPSSSLICALRRRPSLFVRNVPARLRLHLSDSIFLFHLLGSVICGIAVYCCFCSLDLWICSLGL